MNQILFPGYILNPLVQSFSQDILDLLIFEMKIEGSSLQKQGGQHFDRNNNREFLRTCDDRYMSVVCRQIEG